MGGIALLPLANWASGNAAVAWLDSIPVKDVGEALFTIGLIAIFVEYINQANAET
ncbi:hypothetical protein ACFY0B_18295 [Streptomyces sp. NPDC001797]|uniref:hypothetical protein n=1 Tax=Streptomyces sp. NPDC001797 TaxID=3364610 RepID=UPI0036A0DA2F